MEIDFEIQNKIKDILKEYNGYVSSKVLFNNIENLDEHTLNGNVVYLEKIGVVKIKVGVDNSYFKIKLL